MHFTVLVECAFVFGFVLCLVVYFCVSLLDIVVGGLRFYRDSSSIFFFIFVSYPTSSLNGTQPKPATCSEVSAI